MAEIGAESGQGEDKRGKAAGGRLHDGVKALVTLRALGVCASCRAAARLRHERKQLSDRRRTGWRAAGGHLACTRPAPGLRLACCLPGKRGKKLVAGGVLRWSTSCSVGSRKGCRHRSGLSVVRMPRFSVRWVRDCLFRQGFWGCAVSSSL